MPKITLDSIIEIAHIVYSDTPVFIMDGNFTIKYLSKMSSKIFKLNSSPDNRNIYEILATKDEVATEQIKYINSLLQSKIKCEFIIFNPSFDCGYHTTTCRANVYIDNDKSIIGYIYEFAKINFNQFVNIYNLFNAQTPINKKIRHTSINLTNKESEILFLYCLKFTSKEIAEILNHTRETPVSHNTVGNIIRQQLYRKFNVYNHQSLINNTLQANHELISPKSLIKTQIILTSNHSLSQ